MGSLTRAHDWSATPLGPIETWPSSLRTAVSMMLNSRFPAYLVWGPEMLSFYNDAYRPILGSKPEALGRPFQEVWSEAWDVVGPIARQALAGQASYFEDLPLTLERHAYPEQTWWTFSYSPIHDEMCCVAGVLCTVHETTQKVLNERRLAFLVTLSDGLRSASPVEVGVRAAGLLGAHLGVARVGYGEIDAAQEVVAVKEDWTNGRVESLAGEARILDAFGPDLVAELRAGRIIVVDDSLADPRAGQAYAATWASIGTRALIVAPLVKSGRLRALLYVHEPQPRNWSREEMSLVQDVAERTWDAIERAHAETALRAGEALKSAILDAALDCIITVGPDSRVVEWNPAAERTFGYAADEVLGKDMAQLIIPPELRERHYTGMVRYLTNGEGPVLGHRIELEALRRDGSRFPVELAISPMELDGRPHFTAYLRDISERHRTEAALRDREQRLRATYESAFAGIAEVDEEGCFLRVNEELCAITGYTREELEKLRFRDITHPDDLPTDLELFYRLLAGDLDTYKIEKRFFRKDGEPIWVELAASVVRNEARQPLYGVRVVRDISDRKRWEKHQRLLINELNHRVKNTLATVQSIAAQTFRGVSNESASKVRSFEERLFALARAHDVLTRENWEGAELSEVITQVLEPYLREAGDRFHVHGPRLRLKPGTALALAMAVHELATNAAKYGALSPLGKGRVLIRWAVTSGHAPALHLRWKEMGGPPVIPPTRRGFGTRLIERMLADDLSGEVKLAFDPSGVVCVVRAPLASGLIAAQS